MLHDKSLRDLNVKIGTKETVRHVEAGQAVEVFVALDADAKLVYKITSLCQKKNVRLTRVDSMRDLGKACGIEVGAAMAAVIQDEA